MKKSDEQEQKYRKELMKGLPPINLGALFMPPIWGPANGIWITILYYPLWLFADNLFYASFTDPSPLSVIFSIIVAVLLAAVTIVFARVSPSRSDAPKSGISSASVFGRLLWAS